MRYNQVNDNTMWTEFDFQQAISNVNLTRTVLSHECRCRRSLVPSLPSRN